jgi:hypothetical protein
VSQTTTVDDLTEEIFERLARSGEMPPYLPVAPEKGIPETKTPEARTN